MEQSTTPNAQDPALDEPVARVLDVLFDAFARAYGEATVLKVDGRSLIDGLGSERADLEAVFDLGASVRERLAHLEDWPAASDAAAVRLEARFEDVRELSDEERRLLAEMMVATFLAGAELIGPDPDHDRLQRAKAIDDRLPAPPRLIGKPLSPLRCAWYLGLHVKDD